MVDAGPGSYARAGHHACACLISTSTEILNTLKRKSRLLLKKLGPRRDFRVGTTPAPEFTGLDLKSRTGLKACRYPLCLLSSSLLKTGTLSLPLKTGVQLPLPGH